MKNRFVFIGFFAALVLFLNVCEVYAKVPEFKLKFPTSPVKRSIYTPFQGKILIKLIPEKHIAIYGDESEILIISDTPFMEFETRYRVDVTKDGHVDINYFRDLDMDSDIPLPFTRKMKEEDYDKKTIKLELPFILKNRDKKVVYVNHRLEITIPYRGSKKWYRQEMKKRRRRF